MKPATPSPGAGAVYAYSLEMAIRLGSADDASVFNSILHYLKMHRNRARHHLAGRTWCHMSVGDLHGTYPWLHERTVRRILADLVGKHGLLRRASPQQRAHLQRATGESPWNQTNWFALEDEAYFLGSETPFLHEDRNGRIEETPDEAAVSSRPEVAASERTAESASERTTGDASPIPMLLMRTAMQQHAATLPSHTPSDQSRNDCDLPVAAGPGGKVCLEPHANGCALPRAAADMDTQRTPDGLRPDDLPIAVPPPSPPLPSQAVASYDAGAELLRRQGIAAAKAAALAQGRSAEELREWIRIAKGKRHPTGFLVAMLSANEPLPAEAVARLSERERLEAHQRRAHEQEQEQAAADVPDLCDLFPEYRHRVRRWRDYTPKSASPGPTVPSPSPELAAMQNRSVANGAAYTRESCHAMNR